MKIAWGQHVSDNFIRTVWDIHNRFEWPDEYINWLMACMAFETAGTFNPKIRNAAGSGAVGLIQFMPVTALQLGTSVDELAAMSAVDQLQYVEQYFSPYAHKIKSLSDMYCAIFAPKYIGYPGDAVLYSEGAAYRQNAPLDENSDGKITKSETAYFVQKALWKGLQPKHVREWNKVPNFRGLPEIIKDMEQLLTKLKTL